MRSSFCLLLLCLTTSCSIYKNASTEQYGLANGMPVSDIEQSIYETESGPNVFLGLDRDDRLGCCLKNPCVWMESYVTKEGYCVEGHFIRVGKDD